MKTIRAVFKDSYKNPDQKSQNNSNPDFGKIIAYTFAGLAILGIIVWVGISFSKKGKGSLVLPQGTYLGPDSQDNQQPPTAPLTFTTEPGTPWVDFTGSKLSYTFSYPQTLPLATFPNDKSDSVAIVWGNIPPEKNILLNLEPMRERNYDPAKTSKENYVRNWHQFFSGLKDISSLTTFVNSNGLAGYRAVYINNTGQTPTVDIFLEVPGNNETMIHLGNGVLESSIFDRIVDSVDIVKASE